MMDDQIPGREHYRQNIVWFFQEMAKKLTRDQHKGDWLDQPVTQLLTNLFDEVDELVEALKKDEGVIEECADVANFAMMIADIYRMKKEHHP